MDRWVLLPPDEPDAPGDVTASPARRRGVSRLGWAIAKVTACVLVASAALVAPWRWLTPPTTAFILRERLEGRPVYQRWIPWEKISRDLVLCVVVAEDQKFASHHGFDLESIRKATLEKRRRPRGASTISQQVAKNLFLWPGRSFVRKGIEGYLTVLIEQLWPKRRILEVYLNVAEFGPGLYGAAAASEVLFGKPASQLTRREAALLAGALPSPKRMSAARPSAYLSGRAAEIEALAGGFGGSHLAGL